MSHPSVRKPLSSLKSIGGRSSVSGATVTVFGGTGFLGRYVINRLGKMGCRVIVPFRGDEIMVRHLKPMGDLGVVNFFDMSIREPEQIEEAVTGSNIVINLLGKHFETSRWSFQDVHASFPAVLGTICAEQGVDRLVHMSALGASASSPSAWARSKAVGEENVRAAFPATTILRPAPIYGDEDRLLNRIAKLSRAFPLLPLVDGDAKQQPVFCDDLAKAVVEAASNRDAAGKTYSLCGPKVYTNLQMAEYVFKVSCIDAPCRLASSRHATPRHAAPHATQRLTPRHRAAVPRRSPTTTTLSSCRAPSGWRSPPPFRSCPTPGSRQTSSRCRQWTRRCLPMYWASRTSASRSLSTWRTGRTATSSASRSPPCSRTRARSSGHRSDVACCRPLLRLYFACKYFHGAARGPSVECGVLVACVDPVLCGLGMGTNVQGPRVKGCNSTNSGTVSLYSNNISHANKLH